MSTEQKPIIKVALAVMDLLAAYRTLESHLKEMEELLPPEEFKSYQEGVKKMDEAYQNLNNI